MKISTGSVEAFAAWTERHATMAPPSTHDARKITGEFFRPFLGIDVIWVAGISPIQAVLTQDGIVAGVIDLSK